MIIPRVVPRLLSLGRSRLTLRCRPWMGLSRTGLERHQGSGMDLPTEFVWKGPPKTFECQDQLPSLPLPNLEKTLQKYLESVRPVLTDDEYRQTEFVVQQFGSGQGRNLHKKLVEKYKNEKNWLEKMWESKAYLEGRYPSAPFVNISGPGPYYNSVFPPKPGSQLERAGLILYTTGQFWKMLRSEKLPVDPAGKDAFSCMNQYSRLYNTCKIPGLKEDTFSFDFKTEAEGECPSHVVVICRGRFFVLDILHKSGDFLTPPELESQLRFIRETCEQSGPGPGLGALTGDNRTRWAENRAYLKELHPSHAENLRVIESAMVGFVLDDQSPEDYHKLGHAGLVGEPRNRWFDKSVCQVVFKNGTVISNCDHAPFDGIVYIYATYFSHLCLEKCGGKWHGSKSVRKLEHPQELVFHCDDKIRGAIQTASDVFHATGKNVDCYVPFYTGYGKKFIRSFKLHPDAYVQMALQLAYYRMYQKPGPTYETATVRKYYHGRTETLRSCTSEAITWAQAMLDRHVEPQTKFRLFGLAMQKHLKNMIEGTDLQGCDRHLLGLSVMAEEEGIPTPAIFTDPAFTKSGGGGNFVLSTSFVGYTPVLGGCPPMCEHGYGCFYSIQPEQISFYLTSWISDDDTSGRELFNSLAISLNEMRTLIEVEAPKLANL